jgi:hypothetical protein
VWYEIGPEHHKCVELRHNLGNDLRWLPLSCISAGSTYSRAQQSKGTTILFAPVLVEVVGAGQNSAIALPCWSLFQIPVCVSGCPRAKCSARHCLSRWHPSARIGTCKAAALAQPMRGSQIGISVSTPGFFPRFSRTCHVLKIDVAPLCL